MGVALGGVFPDYFGGFANGIIVFLALYSLFSIIFLTFGNGYKYFAYKSKIEK